ncbi:transcription factor WhiB [Nocardia tenerifensis]|uniref:Transcription factor WhiB n=1 Tax=Nocardia tenerifensis TaxID=228006 RepID=A0A318JNB0_9NOCA|nr:WhiB family transcriptional regulator [Nocardia tenerifensis]PXX52793.1 transcription factor WhiB [Nocardia tenerifensis]
MTATELVDPVVFADRICRGIPQAIFFPRGRQRRAIEKAKAYCRVCPRLTHCAEWAQSRARSGALANCVIAAVHLPGTHKGQADRDAAAAELAEIAGRGVLLVSDVEGAA